MPFQLLRISVVLSFWETPSLQLRNAAPDTDTQLPAGIQAYVIPNNC
jgi:hypothetical protein